MATLRKWRKRHNWDGRLDLSTCRQIASVHESMQALKAAAAEFSPDVVTGLMVEIARQLQQKLATTPALDDIKCIVEVIEKMVELREQVGIPGLTSSPER